MKYGGLFFLYCEKNYNGSIVGIVQYQRPNPVAWSLKPSLSCDVCCRLITSISLSIMIKERKERRKIKPQTNKEDCALILYQGLTRVHILRWILKSSYVLMLIAIRYKDLLHIVDIIWLGQVLKIKTAWSSNHWWFHI